VVGGGSLYACDMRGEVRKKKMAGNEVRKKKMEGNIKSGPEASEYCKCINVESEKVDCCVLKHCKINLLYFTTSDPCSTDRDLDECQRIKPRLSSLLHSSQTTSKHQTPLSYLCLCNNYESRPTPSFINISSLITTRQLLMESTS
jgi:hypothetical protein